MSTAPTSADGEVLRSSFPDIDETLRPYTKVSYGLPFDVACKKHVDGFLDAHRVYIIASKGLSAASDALERLQRALGPKHVGTWLGIPAHTPFDALIPILHDVREKRADCIVTLGGGSLADGAKALVYVIENGINTLEELQEFGKQFEGTAPPEAAVGIGNAPKISLVFMPTTLSAAEYSKYAGCTNPADKCKIQFTHPGMYAKLLILDGALCRTTPDWVWRSTGVRAIDHCVECTCSLKALPAVDQAAARGLRRLVKSLFAYARDPDDMAARLESQLGSKDAMTGLILRVMAGASHGIGHNLGPLGVGHGQTSCILMPAVMKYNARVNAAKQETVKKVLWDEPEIREVLTKHNLAVETSDLGDALRAIFNELGMPKSLKDVGVGRDKWDQLALNSLRDPFAPTNPIPLEKKEQVLEILEMVSGDDE